MTYQGLNLSLIFRVAPLVSLPHHLVADLCEFASLQPCHAGVFCCQVFVYVSHPLLPVLFIPSGSLCRAETEKVWEENRGLVGLPPCAECEVAAKRLWTGRALSICWRKMPHIEKVSEILWKKREGRQGGECTGVVPVSTCLVHSAAPASWFWFFPIWWNVLPKM